MSQMLFYLDDDASKLINNLKNIKHNEFEIRFFMNREAVRNEVMNREAVKFLPGIPQRDFEVLKRILLDKGYKELYTTSTIEIFDIGGTRENLRRITEQSQGKIKVRHEIKKSIQNYDILYPDFNLRLSLADEQEVFEPPKNLGQPKMVRKRYRHEYEVKDHKYVLTAIEGSRGEVSFEFEIEYTDIPQTVSNIETDIGLVLPYIVKDTDRFSYIPSSLTNYVRKYQENLRLREVKPQNLTRKEAPDLQKNGYSVTNKLDGEHFTVLSTPDKGIFSINNRIVDLLTAENVPQFVIDTELFKKTFYVFDCMIHDGKNIMNIPHLERLKFVPGKFILKNFSKDLIGFSTTFLSVQKNMETNDGLIFTSEMGAEVKKWKFPEKMTLDFLLRFVGTTRDNKFFVYKLYLGDTQNRIVEFTGSKEYPLKHDNVYFSEKKLIDGGIYELGYNVDKFIMFRNRPDKIVPNFYPTTGVNVWNDIMNPFSQQELLDLLKSGDVPLIEYRKYHNDIKREMISEYCPGKSILDLGAGNGGDLGKYERAGVKYLWAVEPYQKNYEEFKKRLTTSFKSMMNKTKLIVGQAQDTEIITSEMDGQYADIVSSFFSLSFFFFNETDLDQLVETITNTTRTGGLFIGATIDGNRLKKLLKSGGGGKYTFEGGSYELLGDGTIELVMQGTIVDTQRESLVNFKLLRKKLAKAGIVLRESHFFEDNPKLSPSENEVSTLYRTFVFEKKNDDCDTNVLKYVYAYCKNIGIESPQKYTIIGLLEKIKKLHTNFHVTQNSRINMVDKVIRENLEKIKEEKGDEHFPSNVHKDYSPIDYNLFVVDPETSLYSCLMPYQIAPVRNAFKIFVDPFKVRTIVDGTSNIGVDVVNLSQMYPRAQITAYEIVPKIYDKLAKNIKNFGLQDRVRTVNEDFTKVFENISADLVYLDPPFGGRDYKQHDSLPLYLQKEGEDPDESKNVLTIANKLIQKCKYVVLKVPFNFQKDYDKHFPRNLSVSEREIRVKDKVQFKLIFISQRT